MQDELLIDRIRNIVSNIFRDNNIELVAITFKREGGTKILRILADKDNGITADECARMNEIVSEALDKEDFIAENYILEISSPGLDRPLKTKDDFLRIKGKRIHVCTFAPIGEKKEFIGNLESVDDSGITVHKDARLTKIPFDKISKATLDYESLL
jgi:ribosome maturation factor RimP